MATRYIGDACIRILYRKQGDYAGTVSANGHVWHFAALHAPAVGHGPGIGYDSPEAYDSMAASAVAFGSYYTSHNRGDCPEWAPEPECADAISEAAGWATDEEGRGLYAVQRAKGGPIRWVS